VEAGSGAATPGQVPKFEPVVLFNPQERRYPQGLEALLTSHTSWGWDHSVVFSPQGDVIAAALLDGSVRLWNADGTARAVVADAHRGRPVRALSFSPKGDILASAGFDGTLRLWNLDGSPIANRRTSTTTPSSSVSSPDGSRIATAGYDDLSGSEGRRLAGVRLPRSYTDRIVQWHSPPTHPCSRPQSGDVRRGTDGSPRGEPLVARRMPFRPWRFLQGVLASRTQRHGQAVEP
jgi:WD40 repeat protein